MLFNYTLSMYCLKTRCGLPDAMKVFWSESSEDAMSSECNSSFVYKVILRKQELCETVFNDAGLVILECYGFDELHNYGQTAQCL